MPPIEHLLILAALFLLVSILASKLAVRAGVPALLLFLLLGMLAGSDGLGGVYFDQPALVQAVGVVALSLILFAGGLDTRFSDVRPVLWAGLSLATIGVLLTAGVVGAFAHVFLGLPLLEGFLLGAIIASTDAAAVLSVLRGKGIHLRGRIKPLLEFESGSNDPMAVFLTIGLLQLLTIPGAQPVSLVTLFLQQMIIGGVLGLLGGRLLQWTINRLRLEYDGLYPVLTLSGAALIYGITASIGGSGFLAVYVAGLVMNSRNFVHSRSLTQFHDGIAWLMQIAMFGLLGLQVFPSQLLPIAGASLITAFVLMFVARPLGVWVALALSGFDWRDKLFISWAGLRGATPIILATFPLLAGVPPASLMFNVVFFIVLTSVLLQGALLLPVARLLGVTAPPPRKRSSLAYVMDDGIVANDVLEVIVPARAAVAGRQILDLPLPPDVLVVLIGRGDESLVPRGSTIVEAGDHVLMLVPQPLREPMTRLFTEPAPARSD
jgi:cell volume regulation protein A